MILCFQIGFFGAASNIGSITQSKLLENLLLIVDYRKTIFNQLTVPRSSNALFKTVESSTWDGISKHQPSHSKHQPSLKPINLGMAAIAFPPGGRINIIDRVFTMGLRINQIVKQSTNLITLVASDGIHRFFTHGQTDKCLEAFRCDEGKESAQSRKRPIM